MTHKHCCNLPHLAYCHSEVKEPHGGQGAEWEVHGPAILYQPQSGDKVQEKGKLCVCVCVKERKIVFVLTCLNAYFKSVREHIISASAFLLITPAPCADSLSGL